MEQDQREKTTLEVTSVTQILPMVRREMVWDLAKAAAFLGTLHILGYWLNGSTKLLYLGPVLLLVGGLHLYGSRYIPISNRHDSLMSQYGDVYVQEVIWAANEHGIRKLIRTRWFESFADEFCKRRAKS